MSSAPNRTRASRGEAAAGGDSALGGAADRYPDFIVIGTMKSGTTTLFRWIGEHAASALPTVKEPAFFSDERAWSRGIDWYLGLFAHAPRDRLTGEASVGYTDPRRTYVAAGRVREQLPDVRLVCILRHPVERLRSHYRHEVQRGRERQSLNEALRDPQNPYIPRSCYASCLEPWCARFPSDQLFVARAEDLFGEDTTTWAELLHHLGLPAFPRPTGQWNVAQGKLGFTRPMLLAWESGLLAKTDWIPRPVRSVARRLLLRDDQRYRDLLATSREPLSAALLAPVWEDARRLPGLLGQPISWNE